MGDGKADICARSANSSGSRLLFVKWTMQVLVATGSAGADPEAGEGSKLTHQFRWRLPIAYPGYAAVQMPHFYRIRFFAESLRQLDSERFITQVVVFRMRHATV